MFLIRTAFWLTLVIFLLPSNEEEQRAAVRTTGAMVSDVKSFCVRNPDLCEQGRGAFAAFSLKAKYGWRMLNDLMKDQQGTSGVEPASYRQGAVPGSQNTLTGSDLLPIWGTRQRGSKT